MVSFTTIVSALAAASVAAGAAVEKRFNGRATWYLQHGNPGACGEYHSDSDLIVAMNHEQYSRGICGKQVEITNTANGKKVTAVVKDLCPSCPYGAIDLSEATFETLGHKDTGVLNIDWEYTN